MAEQPGRTGGSLASPRSPHSPEWPGTVGGRQCPRGAVDGTGWWASRGGRAPGRGRPCGKGAGSRADGAETPLATSDTGCGPVHTQDGQPLTSDPSHVEANPFRANSLF